MRFVLTVLMVSLLAAGALADTNVSGNITKDSVWTLAKSPYRVVGNVYLLNGFTLQVDSGVVVRFQSGTGLYATYGNLAARYATFTSIKDTAGGLPQKGDWTTIQVGEYNSAPTATLDTCQILFGGSPGYNALYIRNGSAIVRGTVVSNSSNIGVNVYAGSLTMLNSTITNVTNQGLVVQGGTNTVVNGGTIGSVDWPIWYNGSATVTFLGVINFPGNKHNGAYLNFGSTGNMVLDTLSIPYYFVYDFTVNAGATLEIASGNVLKFQSGSLVVHGALKAVAGAGEKIYFTSSRNDNLPVPNSDTNGDGSATVPQVGNWGGIQFMDDSIDSLSVMRRCQVSYAGYSYLGGITMYNAGPTVDSCEMVNNYYGAMMQYVSNPVFSNNTIGSSSVVPIAMSFAANPVFDNNAFSFSDNQFDAIGLLGGILPASSVLPIRSVTSIPNVTYLMLESVTVPSGMSLTINKGIVIKSYQGYRITVKGTLTANATPDSMITMTSVKDDNFGNPGDTNKDGTGTVPQVGDWSGIVFEASSDTSSILNYCRIRYGSLGSSYYNTRWIYGGEITTVNASPTISNCELKDVEYAVYAFQASNPKISNNTIINTQYTPVALSVSADPVFTGNTFTNAKWRALGIIGENLGTSGTIKQRTVAGITNITYVLLEDLTVNSGTNVLVEPGVVIKCNQGTGIYVNGGFRAKGTTAAGPVVFTSLKDDNFGNSGLPLPGDTNGDGNQSSPNKGDWSTIQFLGTSDDSYSLLDSCLIKYGAGYSWGGVSYLDAGSTISNSTISDGGGYGVKCDGSSTPTVSNVTLANCNADPIAMSLKANPTFLNITFAANGSQGIRILEGTLSSNAELAKRDVAGINNIAYIVDQLTIGSNAVLTIDPGVVIKFVNYYSSINVQGALIANGTAAQEITFTSFMDDSKGGDTNGNGNANAPDKGNWAWVQFNTSGTDSLNSLRHCVFRYGGGYTYYYYQYGLLRLFSTKAVIDSCVIEQSASSAIGIFGNSTPQVSNTEMNNISETPVTMSMFANPTFSNISSLNVGLMAIGILPETYSVDATIPVRNFAGYSNITYYLYDNCTVNSGTAITIPAGVVFKGSGFVVDGALKVLGQPGNPVVFTDTRDDSYGHPNDTNGDGSASQPSNNGYSWIVFNNISSDSACVVQNAVFRFRDAGITLQTASPTVFRSTFDRTTWGIVLNGVSNPSLDSCTFNNLRSAPLYLSLVSYPSSTSGNVISGTTYRAIAVLDNETLVQDITLPKRNFGGITNIPYLFNNYTIASNAVLTVSPGLVLKFTPGRGMTVRKGLIAEGGSTADSSIVFTDLRDDFYGGDTNADSTMSEPTDYWAGWSGITFMDESLDPLCRLKHAVIRYAGISYNGAAITANNASPSIMYSTLKDNYNAVVANGASNPVVNYCDIYQNAGYGVNNVNKSFNINAQYNWWGNNTGPTHAGNPGGTGQTVSDSVRYTPWLTTGAGSPVAGDVSLNGAVQAYDASLILKWIVDAVGSPLNGLQLQVADVSANGTVTSYDASLILQYVVGKVTTFPIELETKGQSGPEQAHAIAALRKTATVGTFSLGNGAVARGQQVTLQLAATGVNDLYSGDFTITFDPAQLKSVSASAIGMASGAVVASSSGKGIMHVVFASSSVLKGDGALIAVTFEAQNDVRGTVDAPVTIGNVMLNETRVGQSVQATVAIEGKPLSFGLDQNYPNPFNPSTTISYRVPDDGLMVKVDIFNLTGQHVKTLVDGLHRAGEYHVVWDATTDSGEKAGSGLYFYRIIGDKFTSVKKMLLVK